MSGKPKPDGLLGLSMNEAKLILLANYLAGDTQKVDYEKLAQLGGYKTGQSASVMYRNAKRKLSEFDPGNPVLKPGSGSAGGATPDGGTPASSTPRKKTPGKRKNATGENGEEGTPTKAKRERKMPAMKGLEDSVVDGGESYGLMSSMAIKPEQKLFPGVKEEDMS